MWAPVKTKAVRTGIQNLTASADQTLGACEVGQVVLKVEQACWTGRRGAAPQGSERSVLGTASRTVGITGTAITAKAEVSYGDRELGAEGKGTLPSEHICFIISRSIILL